MTFVGGFHAVGWGDALTDNDLALLKMLAKDGSITVHDESILRGMEENIEHIVIPDHLWPQIVEIIKGKDQDSGESNNSGD